MFPVFDGQGFCIHTAVSPTLFQSLSAKSLHSHSLYTSVFYYYWQWTCPEMHEVTKLANSVKFCQSSRFERMREKEGSDESTKFSGNSKIGECSKILPHLSHLNPRQNLAKFVIFAIVFISGHKCKMQDQIHSNISLTIFI